jgi:hypothetical protein
MGLKRTVFHFVVALAILQIPAMPAALAAKHTPAPKVGNCYALTYTEVMATRSARKPVTCAKSHTVETYRVVRWPKSADPNLLSEVERAGQVAAICEPWVGTSTTFTNWSYKIPTAAQWKAKNRMVRCDAYKISELDPQELIVLVGKKLDIK